MWEADGSVVWMEGPQDRGVGDGRLGWIDGSMMDIQLEGSLDGHFLSHFQALPTFKVHSAIPIEVHISDNFLYVSVSHLMT